MIEGLVAELVARGDVTAAVAVVGGAAGEEQVAVAGRTRVRGGRPVRAADRFDLASLSKPIAATLALRLDSDRRLRLETPLSEIWGDRVGEGLARVTLEDLLRHRSGLPAWAPLYRRFRRRDRAIEYLLSGETLLVRRSRYSDLGYILWALSVERALGTRFERLLRRWVLDPLGLSGIGVSPGPAASVVECPLDNSREVELASAQGVAVARGAVPEVGVIQDGNARFLGGPHAHAGLFGSAIDLFRLASEWLSPRRVLSASAVRRALGGGRGFALGWARPTLRGSAGPALDRSAFGHVGFTGGSVWIDPKNDRIMVLLAHRTSVAVKLAPTRRRLHRAALGSA